MSNLNRLNAVHGFKSLTMQVALSPDGHWLAYSGNATGRSEIYLTPFPAATSTRLVSRDGGAEARWAPGEVVYVENWIQELLAKVKR